MPTKMNLADLASKGLQADDAKGWSFFHSGPSFLLRERAEWPVESRGRCTISAHAWRRWRDLSTDFGGGGIGFGRSLGLGYSMPHGTYDAVRYGDESEVEIVRHEAEVAWPIMATARLSRWSDKVRRVALIKTTLMTLLEKVRENPLSHQPDLDLGRRI